MTLINNNNICQTLLKLTRELPTITSYWLFQTNEYFILLFLKNYQGWTKKIFDLKFQRMSCIIKRNSYIFLDSIIYCLVISTTYMHIYSLLIHVNNSNYFEIIQVQGQVHTFFWFSFYSLTNWKRKRKVQFKSSLYVYEMTALLQYNLVI